MKSSLTWNQEDSKKENTMIYKIFTIDQWYVISQAEID